MNNFFYKLKIILLSFLGIGFITRFRELFASLAALILVLLIPDNSKTEILFILIIVFLLFFEFSGLPDTEESINKKFVFRRAVGIWIAALSPYVLITIFWAIVCLAVYYLFFALLDRSKTFNRQCKNPKCEFLKKDIVAGILSLVTIQILYSAAALLPFVYLFFNR